MKTMYKSSTKNNSELDIHLFYSSLTSTKNFKYRHSIFQKNTYKLLKIYIKFLMSKMGLILLIICLINKQNK